MNIKPMAIGGLALALALSAACGKGDSKPKSDDVPGGADAIDIALTDSGITISGPVRPGGTLRVHNDGQQMHMMVMARFKAGKTIKDANKALKSDDESAMDKVADQVGAPANHLPPGHAVEVSTPELTRGHYLVADFYPAEGGDGSPNVFSSGLAELVVSGHSVAAAPSTDATYTLAAGTTLQGPTTLGAGRHTFAFDGLSTKDGKEIAIYRLNAGETPTDISKKLAEIFDANDGAGLTVKGAGQQVAARSLFWVLPPDHGGRLIVATTLAAGHYAVVASDIDADDPNAPLAALTIEVK